jgi:hypothetical protein
MNVDVFHASIGPVWKKSNTLLLSSVGIVLFHPECAWDLNLWDFMI